MSAKKTSNQKRKAPIVSKPKKATPPATTNRYKEYLATMALAPSVNAAAVIEVYGQPFGEQDLSTLSKMLCNVQNGDMKPCEAMLMDQAHALQSIFMNFSRRALKQEYQRNLESFFRMAMKAQNQCRMTLETLATIKNPPIIYAKQANIAQGHQQVNNGLPAHAGENTNQPNELLEEAHGQRLDNRAASTAAGFDPAMATVGEIHRTTNA